MVFPFLLTQQLPRLHAVDHQVRIDPKVDKTCIQEHNVEIYFHTSYALEVVLVK